MAKGRMLKFCTTTDKYDRKESTQKIFLNTNLLDAAEEMQEGQA